MARIIFAGLNTGRYAKALVGRHVLVSYADIQRWSGLWDRILRPAIEHGVYASVMLDSGAFTELSVPGFKVDLAKYGEFARENEHLFTDIVNLDDIGGNTQRSNDNLVTLQQMGLSPMPVFHQGEPWDQLKHCLDVADRIGVGFKRPIAGANEFLDEFFRRVQSLRPKAQVHGFAMTRWARDGYPFESTDSTTWIAEYRALRNSDRKALTVGGDHGSAAKAARLFWNLSTNARIKLAIDSHEGLVREEVPFRMDSEGIHEDWKWLMSQALHLKDAPMEHLRGQARTIVARMSTADLARALWQAREITRRDWLRQERW